MHGGHLNGQGVLEGSHSYELMWSLFILGGHFNLWGHLNGQGVLDGWLGPTAMNSWGHFFILGGHFNPWGHLNGPPVTP